MIANLYFFHNVVRQVCILLICWFGLLFYNKSIAMVILGSYLLKGTSNNKAINKTNKNNSLSQ